MALAEAGVGTIILTSRSGKLYSGQGLEAMVEQIEALGAKVAFAKCDVSDEESVKSSLQWARETFGKINHVLCAAGLSDMEVIERTFTSKVNGTWYVHKHTLEDKIDSFISYSSMTNFLGTGGFQIYGGACSYLEELSRWRRAHGLAATTILFPEVMGVGMASAGGTKLEG